MRTLEQRRRRDSPLLPPRFSCVPYRPISPPQLAPDCHSQRSTNARPPARSRGRAEESHFDNTVACIGVRRRQRRHGEAHMVRFGTANHRRWSKRLHVLGSGDGDASAKVSSFFFLASPVRSTPLWNHDQEPRTYCRGRQVDCAIAVVGDGAREPLG